MIYIHIVRNQIPNISQEKDTPPYDFVVVTTKNVTDVPPSVAEIIQPAVTPGHTAILLLQNGLNIERPVVAAFPSNPVLSGITIIGAREQPRGTIRHDNDDISYIGAFDHPGVDGATSEAAARRFVALYGACAAVDCHHDADVRFQRWKKLLYNASYNSVAAVLRTDTTRLRASEHIIDDLVRPVMHEIVAIAKAADSVDLPAPLVDKTITVDRYESFFKPSMCQDVEKGNLLELENIIGEPLREAQRARVHAPTLTVLYGLLKGLQFRIKEAKGLVEVPVTSTEGLKYGDKMNQKWS